MQNYTSKNTSVNATKVPAVFRKALYSIGEINLDYGGGKYDTATRYLQPYGKTNLIYDPYNRTKEHNQNVEDELFLNCGADSCTMSNVLNVIDKLEDRLAALTHAKSLMKPMAYIYITVYEGDRSGCGRETKKDCWQANRPLKSYLKEVKKVFYWARVYNGMIIAQK